MLPSKDLDEDGVYLIKYPKTGTLEALELYNNSMEEIDIHRTETQEMPCPRKLVHEALRNKLQPWKWHKDPIRPEPKNPTGKQTKHTNSQHLAEEAAQGKPELLFEEIVLKEYWDYKEVFTGRPKG